MAGAYTVFANGGVHLNPWMVASVRNANGDIVSDFAPEAHQVMDPRAAYLTQSLLEGVMARGTGASARSVGFNAPAAGKTGTSHDVWFAGYSSNLLCVVWVGNDDYTDISHDLTRPLQGADAAAPIWGEFMKLAVKLPQYSDMRSFTAPEGVTTVRLDKVTNLLADASCPNDYTAAFLDGTAPANSCTQMSDTPQSMLARVFGGDSRPPTISDPSQTPAPVERTDINGNPLPAADTNPDGTPKKKQNFFKKLFGAGKTPRQSSTPDQQPAAPIVRQPPPQ